MCRIGNRMPQEYLLIVPSIVEMCRQHHVSVKVEAGIPEKLRQLCLSAVVSCIIAGVLLE